MNISEWPLSKIMQMPDEAFGSRWLVGGEVRPTEEQRLWTISPLAFPETIVVWELYMTAWTEATARAVFRIALGDQIPISTAMMNALEPVFPGIGYLGPQPQEIHLKDYPFLGLRKIRMPVKTSGRRLVIEYFNSGAATSLMTCILTVSSVPREVPDCLISV